MNLEQLRKRIADNVTEVVMNDGAVVRLRKMSAAGGAALGEFAATLVKPEGVKDSPADMAAFYAFVLSKTICDEAGELTLDSDEGRELLAKLSGGELFKLGKRSHKWSGLDADEDSKKNSPPTVSLPSSSADCSPRATEAPTKCLQT